MKLDWIFRNTVGRLPCKDIGDGRGNVFFNRYTVVKAPWFSVYLHQFMRGDADRCLHDHPWPFASIILRVGYWEEMRDFLGGANHYSYNNLGPNDLPTGLNPTVRHWRRPGTVLFRRARDAHRIDVEPGTRPWSLVIVGRKVRDWGFYTPAGWWKWRPGETPICEE